MDSIHLHGAEAVRSASHTMRSAAEDMRYAANTFSEAVDRQRQFLDEALTRFEAAVAKLTPPTIIVHGPGIATGIVKSGDMG